MEIEAYPEEVPIIYKTENVCSMVGGHFFCSDQHHVQADGVHDQEVQVAERLGHQKDHQEARGEAGNVTSF